MDTLASRLKHTASLRGFMVETRLGGRACNDGGLISVDHSRLGMGPISERLAKQPLGSISVTER
jgi:hypothetical protein